VLPSWNFSTFSTTAVASFIVVDEGSFACVITWPVKKIGSLTDCKAVCVQRINFLTSQVPSDTLNISSAGVYTSDGSLNNILKNALCAFAVPFALYNDLIFLINFLVLTESSVSVGIVLRNSSFIWDKKSLIVWSGSV